MTVAKVLDVISRLPGCSGHASDAVSAYTQVEMKDAPELLHLSEEDCPEHLDHKNREQEDHTIRDSIYDPDVPL